MPNGSTKPPGTAGMSCTGASADFENTVAFAIHCVYTVVQESRRSNKPKCH